MRRFLLRSRSLTGRAGVALFVACAVHACVPAQTERARGPAEPPRSAASFSEPVTSSAVAPPKPTGHRPSPSTTEPVAPVLDFAWHGNAVGPGLRTAREGASADGSIAREDEAYGAGGLGLSGIGEGGGGRGIGLGSIGTIGHGAGAGYGSGSGRLSGAHVSSGLFAPGIRTGEWDDDANYQEFQRYLGSVASGGAAKIDVHGRRFLVVRDAEGRAVPNCEVGVDGLDTAGAKLASVTLTTTSNGRAIFFPAAEIPEARSFVATARCLVGEGQGPTQRFDANAPDGAVKLDLTSSRSTSSDRTVDVAFILDTTGSMSEEIAAVTSTIEKVAQVLSKKGLTVRIGLVEYKDRTDPFVARVHPMTRDVAGFVSEVRAVRAGGGGDTPEDVNTGLAVALDELAWSSESVARLAFVIGDAPPHLDYPGEPSYVESAKRASHDGIQLFTVAASGMDDLGQTVFRQVAMYTGATSLFVMRGGAGPESVGGGDPKSSCGGTQKVFRTADLDKLITGKVERAIALLDEDPMKIPGFGTDVIAKPCQP